MNSVMLAISGRDTLKPLHIYFRPFTNRVLLLNTVNNVVYNWKILSLVDLTLKLALKTLNYSSPSHLR